MKKKVRKFNGPTPRLVLCVVYVYLQQIFLMAAMSWAFFAQPEDRSMWVTLFIVGALGLIYLGCHRRQLSYGITLSEEGVRGSSYLSRDLFIPWEKMYIQIVDNRESSPIIQICFSEQPVPTYEKRRGRKDEYRESRRGLMLKERCIYVFYRRKILDAVLEYVDESRITNIELVKDKTIIQ